MVWVCIGRRYGTILTCIDLLEWCSILQDTMQKADGTLESLWHLGIPIDIMGSATAPGTPCV